MTNDRADSATFSQLAGELLARGVSFRFQAKGRSMLPTIADGDMLHIESANLDSFKVGDIVLFKQGAEFKAHRIVGKHRELFSTRGDAGVDIDEIGPEQIVGRGISKECRDSGRTISISGPIARAEFFWLELRRRVHRLLS
jgi:hypothetical protein